MDIKKITLKICLIFSATVFVIGCSGPVDMITATHVMAKGACDRIMSCSDEETFKMHYGYEMCIKAHQTTYENIFVRMRKLRQVEKGDLSRCEKVLSNLDCNSIKKISIPPSCSFK